MKRIAIVACMVLAAGVANAAEPAAYVGANFGMNVRPDDDTRTMGIVAGYTPMKSLTLETAYERVTPDVGTTTNTVWVNALPTLQVGNLGAYVLGGAGYDFTNSDYVFNAGAGVKFNVTKAVQVDARLRRTFTELTSVSGDNRATVGLNVRF